VKIRVSQPSFFAACDTSYQRDAPFVGRTLVFPLSCPPLNSETIEEIKAINQTEREIRSFGMSRKVPGCAVS
jgi:hypothetical protein